jgi:hypothetical protein
MGPNDISEKQAKGMWCPMVRVVAVNGKDLTIQNATTSEQMVTKVNQCR